MMAKSSTKIKQHDIMDCAAACLASIGAYYGYTLPLARIRQYASTDKRGTSVLGVVEAATKMRFSAKGVRAQPEALKAIPIPAIAHIVVGEGLQHYVVIYKITNAHITIMDPADGEFHKQTWQEFVKLWTGILVIMEPSGDFVFGNEKKSNIQRFLSLLSPHRSVLSQALFGAVIYSVLGLSTSIYVGKIADHVLVDGNRNLLNLMGIAMIIIALFRTLIGIMKSILGLRTGQRIDAALILGYFRHLLYLPQQFFNTMRVGEIVSRVNDAVKIRLFVNNVLLDLLVDAFILLFSVFVMFFYSWLLALVVLASVPLYLVVYLLYNRFNKKCQRRVMEKGAELESHFVESIGAVSTVKQFGVEGYVGVVGETKFVRLLRNTYLSARSSILSGSSVELISSLITIVVLWVGSSLAIEQRLTPGTLMMFYSLIGYVMSPLGALISANQSVQDALIAADRLFQIMDLECDGSDSEEERINLTSQMIGDIEFKDVCFSYGTGKEVLVNVNLVVEKGKVTALVGESGSGKTTLMQLLQKLYKPQCGRIAIGRYDLMRVSDNSLRRYVGAVPQHVDLFEGSLLSNIALGDVEPDIARIEEIVDELGLRKFLNGLPKGYSTLVGEHGMSLSGGERQRIAIARAMYRNPQVLIFDEATASLDSLSEQYVKRTVSRLVNNGTTVLLIAHRLSTVKEADKVVVMKEGKIEEVGTHKTLLEKKGEYWRLWSCQMDVREQRSNVE